MDAAKVPPSLFGPAPTSSRSRSLHWAAWAVSIVAFVVLWIRLVRGAASVAALPLVETDLAISVAFAFEFFTRSGFRQQGLRYARWRWFDFLAMVPVLFLERYVPLATWFVVVVLVARFVRMVDRTMGDGFAKRNALALVEAVEEEISDRVLLKILGRIEGELEEARFGEAAAEALAKNKDRILGRIYGEQTPEAGTLSRLASATGIQGAVERAEAHVFDVIVRVVGSPETDALVRQVVAGSFERARTEIGRSSWRSQLGFGRQPSDPRRTD